MLTLMKENFKLVQAVASVVLLGGFMTLCSMRDAGLRQEGAVKRDKQIVKANQHAVDKGSRAADRSADPRVRGVVDPTTRD